MEVLYQKHKDIAEFRMVYIREAHASDSSWPVEYAREKGITEHKNYEQRCTTAEMLLKDKKLTIPCIIDDMDDSVNKAYAAWPDRVYLVRTDGRLAVAAKRGPWGFKPALDEMITWLNTFAETREEPALPEGALEAALKREAEKKKKAAENSEPSDQAEGSHEDQREQVDQSFASLTGDWKMTTDFNGQTIEAVMSLSFVGEEPKGTWASMGQEMEMSEIAFDGATLTFKRPMGRGGMMLTYEGTVRGHQTEGAWKTDQGEWACNGSKLIKEDNSNGG